jgi:hypothetical protein
MPEYTKEDTIEDEVGLTEANAFEQTTSGESVTGKHLYIDGGDGTDEKEVTTRSHSAGASSEAPASSGIPSAETQAKQ